MTKLNISFPPIPLKRYFTFSELCALACLDEARFLEWQSQYNLPFGRGGQFYSRQDILSLRSISPTIIEMQQQPRLEDVQQELEAFGRSVEQAKEKLLAVVTTLQKGHN